MDKGYDEGFVRMYVTKAQRLAVKRQGGELSDVEFGDLCDQLVEEAVRHTFALRDGSDHQKTKAALANQMRFDGELSSKSQPEYADVLFTIASAIEAFEV